MAYNVTVDGKPGAALVRVNSITSAKNDDWKPLESVITNAINQQRQENMFQLFIGALSDRAKVVIVNEAYLNALMQQ